MRGLIALTAANLRSFTRDRAAVFWTLAFPVVFVILFGTIFAGGSSDYTLGWVDQDGTRPVQALREAFTANAPVELLNLSIDEAQSKMLAGDLDGIVVVPRGVADAVAAGHGGQPGPPVAITVITDPS